MDKGTLLDPRVVVVILNSLLEVMPLEMLIVWTVLYSLVIKRENLLSH